MSKARTLEWDWYPGTIPENVVMEEGAYLETTFSFYCYRSESPVGARFGRGSSIYLGTMFDLGVRARIEIGAFTLMNGARIMCDSEIVIGDYALISWNVVLMDTYRLPENAAQRREQLERAPRQHRRHAAADVPSSPIRIERNVWIGFDSCILPGVTIGEGSIVGARSVVTRDVPPFTIVAGNPARIIRDVPRDELPSNA
jgi:acetyltransferase-like isoleucine patch superfamily enzyme